MKPSDLRRLIKEKKKKKAEQERQKREVEAKLRRALNKAAEGLHPQPGIGKIEARIPKKGKKGGKK